MAAIHSLEAARRSLQASIDRSRSLSSVLDSSAPRLAEIHSRLPSLAAAVRPIRADPAALAEVGGHIDRAVGPAAAVLRVFDAVHGLEPSLLSDPRLDLPGYLAVLARLEEALRFLSDNCGLAVSWLDDILDYLDDNALADPPFLTSLKSALAALKPPLDGGLLPAALDKLESEFRRLLTENTIPLPMSDIDNSTAATTSAIAPSPLPAPVIRSLLAILDRMIANNRLDRCFAVYIDVRGSNVRASLRALNLDYLDITDFTDVQSIEPQIEKWGQHLEFAVKHLFEAEYKLCNEIFDRAGPPDVWVGCFAEIAAQAGMLAFLRFGLTVTESKKDPLTGTTTTILESESGADQPFMGLTENCSPTFLSTGDPCLDFFFQVVPDTPTETIYSLLTAAWDKDPLTALKLVFHLRGVRGTSMSDRKGFYACALWLHENHPKTFALNVDMVAEFGYMKDLPELLHRLVSGPDAPKTTRWRARVCRSRQLQILEEQDKDEAQADYAGAQEMQFPNAGTFTEAPDLFAEAQCHFSVAQEDSNEDPEGSTGDQEGSYKDQESSTVDQEGYNEDQEGSTQDQEEATDDEKGSVEDRITRRRCRCRICRSKIRKKALRQLSTTEERLAAERAKVKIRMEDAATLRRHKRAVMAARAVERYSSDHDYRLLHDRTSDFFAALLSSDLRQLKSGDTSRISLAAKWCPSLGSSYDRSTLLCESIARRVFPLDSDPEYSMIEEQHYLYRVRRKLEKEVLVPLRRVLELPEVYISAGLWGSLPYSRVASVAMKNYKKLFKKHDAERFYEYLSLVRQGKAKIAAGALLPHEILASVLRRSDWYEYQSDYNEDEDEDKDENDEVAELQWRRMVSDLSEIGKLRNCIAVCDVSGSMEGTPMEVCIALGLLLSELSDDPWRGRVITFSENPVLHQIKGESLKEKAQFVKDMDWGANTNFQLVFDQILAVAVEGNLEAEKMIKRVFVFSDMEFDEASGSTNYGFDGRRNCNNWETDYQVICRKFEESGYGSAVPEIVFWNLRDSRSTPVLSGQKGVALVSGFSKNLMKVFLESDGTLSPKEVMETAIAGEEYTKLKIFD